MVALADIAVVILAAGLSRRYGSEDKLLADLEGKPLAMHVATTLSEMALAPVIAVCRPDSDLIPLFQACGFTVVINPDSDRGQASSLALGIEAAGRVGAAAALVCLADMPRVRIEHLQQLLRAVADSPSGMVASSSQGMPPSSPAVFAARHFPALRALTGDRGARHLLGDATLVDAPYGQLADFDLPADFASSA